MSTSFRDEPPAFNAVWERLLTIQDIREAFDTFHDQTAFAIGDDLSIMRVLQGPITPLLHDGTSILTGEDLTLVHISASDRTEHTQLRIRGPLTQFITYDLCSVPDTLEDGSVEASRDSLSRFRLGRTVFDSFRAENAIDRFLISPYLLAGEMEKYAARIGKRV